MLNIITSISVPVIFTVEASGQQVEIERVIELTKVSSKEDTWEYIPGIDIHCLHPDFVRGVNRVIAELNAADHDSTFKYLA